MFFCFLFFFKYIVAFFLIETLISFFFVFLRIHKSWDTCCWAYVVTQSFVLQSGEPRPILAAERLSLSRTPVSSPIMMQLNSCYPCFKQVFLSFPQLSQSFAASVPNCLQCVAGIRSRINMKMMRWKCYIYFLSVLFSADYMSNGFAKYSYSVPNFLGNQSYMWNVYLKNHHKQTRKHTILPILLLLIHLFFLF